MSGIASFPRDLGQEVLSGVREAMQKWAGLSVAGCWVPFSRMR